MRTQLGSYCQQFDSTVRPVLEDLTTAISALDAADDERLSKTLRAPLCGLQHDLQALCDKVRDQQAFVLIFGPLKSGKSTLMNAIAAAYVSEVSSLPAYPCLVFVRAGGSRKYVVTSYDGRAVTFSDAVELSRHIDAAHRDLANAIREAEQGGVVFEPQQHFPAAIRRVDVHVPDSELATDSTVLVDTPGLYTRMRFGYDQMTRDFRNAAACAIFVVKSDTLFLEQVFAEFEQLLELFSRIFLVVNVDAKKRDVGPDGKLVPSLEQSHPEAVLQAFEQLAMSAPLKRAASEGRVRMYPVDLLHAASSVLQKRSPANQPEGFREFRKDLSSYLASQQYVAAFLHDSLQRGLSLLDEAANHGNGDEAGRLRGAVAEIDDRLEFLRAEQQRVAGARQLDWTEAFASNLRELETEVERAARDHGAKLLRTLGASIDTWFLSSHSLEWLTGGQWTPLVHDYRTDVLTAARRAFDQQQQQFDAGLDLPVGIPELMRRAGIDLATIRDEALESLGPVQWEGSASVPVEVRAIPIRRGIFDYVTFRSLGRVRIHLFGGLDTPDRKVPGREKASRLGEAGRLHLHQCVAQFRTDLTPRTVAVVRNYFGGMLQRTAAAAIAEKLTTYEPELLAQQRDLESQRARLMALCDPLQRVATSSTDLKQKLVALRHQFDRDTVALEKDVVLEPQPPHAKAPGRRESSRRGTKRHPSRP